MERTLIIIKPDAVQRGLVGSIIKRFEQRGLRIVGLKFMQISRELAERHYAVHEGKSFYEGLLNYITSGPVAVMALEGPQAIAAARATMGATRDFGIGWPGSAGSSLQPFGGRSVLPVDQDRQ
ncbi:MAG: hypothetical protein B6I34_03465 [Anaerolineaceae bacterium 4572_32.1]|nr:MAG: hypothetical protein B6I34_03465 [Anaerolineaceae bacterium 4572_32.1]